MHERTEKHSRGQMNYEEFKRRVRPYKGPSASIEDMRELATIFEDWDK